MEEVNADNSTNTCTNPAHATFSPIAAELLVDEAPNTTADEPRLKESFAAEGKEDTDGKQEDKSHVDDDHQDDNGSDEHHCEKERVSQDTKCSSNSHVDINQDGESEEVPDPTVSAVTRDNVNNSSGEGRSFQGWDDHWCNRRGKQDLPDGDEAEGKQQQQPYNHLNLSNDVKLCTLLQSLSHHIQKRTVELSSSVSALESKLSQVDYDINRVMMYDLLSSDHRSMLFQASEDTEHDDEHKREREIENIPRGWQTEIARGSPTEDEEKNVGTEGLVQVQGEQSQSGAAEDTQLHDKSGQGEEEPASGDYDKATDLGCASMSGLDKMQREEEEAIEDGIKALAIFHDHSASSANQNEHPGGAQADHYFGIGEDEAGGAEGDSGDDDDDDDSFYYYDSAAADLFNQRPLPFVVGSTEFLDSVDGGIGGDIVQEAEDGEYVGESYEEYESSDEDY